MYFRTCLIFIQSYIFNFCIYFKCFFLYLYIYYAKSRLNSQVWGSLHSPNYIPYAPTVHFSITHSVRYQPIFHTLYFMLHCACILNNVVLTIIIEIVEILDGRVSKHSVERVRFVINNLVIVKYGVISPVVCICTGLRLVKIWTLLVK